MQRILATKGYLYLSTPIGIPRLCFNAHRVFSPRQIVANFDKCKLVEFSLVNDEGELIENIDISIGFSQVYACGLFVFEKL